MRSRWLNIDQLVLFCVFIDGDGVEIHKEPAIIYRLGGWGGAVGLGGITWLSEELKGGSDHKKKRESETLEIKY